MGKGWPLLPSRQGAEQRPAAACRSPGLEGGRQPRPGQGEQEAAPVKGIQQHQLDGGDQVGQIAEQGRRQQEQKEQGEHRLASLPHKPAEQPQGQQNHQPGQEPRASRRGGRTGQYPEQQRQHAAQRQCLKPAEQTAQSRPCAGPFAAQHSLQQGGQLDPPAAARLVVAPQPGQRPQRVQPEQGEHQIPEQGSRPSQAERRHCQYPGHGAAVAGEPRQKGAHDGAALPRGTLLPEKAPQGMPVRYLSKDPPVSGPEKKPQAGGKKEIKWVLQHLRPSQWRLRPVKICFLNHNTLPPASSIWIALPLPRLWAATRAATAFPGFRLRRAILRCLKPVGAGAHTRPELAGGPEVRADVGIGPYRGLLRQAPPGQNAP